MNRADVQAVGLGGDAHTQEHSTAAATMVADEGKGKKEEKSRQGRQSNRREREEGTWLQGFSTVALPPSLTNLS
jgi:hypothetical protein